MNTSAICKREQKQKPKGEQKTSCHSTCILKLHQSSYLFFLKTLVKTHSFSKDLLPEKYTRIFSKLLDAQDIRVKAKSIKPLKNSDAKLCYIGLGNDFLDISPKVQAMGKKEQNLKPLGFNGHYQDKS